MYNNHKPASIRFSDRYTLIAGKRPLCFFRPFASVLGASPPENVVSYDTEP
jgi:hypothetical protein